MQRIEMSSEFTRFTQCNRKTKRVLPRVLPKNNTFQGDYDPLKIRELIFFEFKWYDLAPSTYIMDTTDNGYYEALVRLKDYTDFHYHRFTELVRVREGEGYVFIGPKAEIQISNLIEPETVVKFEVEKDTLLSIPPLLTHGFAPKDDLVLEVVANTDEYSEDRMKFGRRDEKYNNDFHDYILKNQI